jgi:UDP-N-acetylmuramoyl-L-alanyl-D-glutamate--2,6-diaminopimelate ligase
MAHWLQRMVTSDCSHAVVELSSEGLAQSRSAGLELDAVCVTNVHRDHLDVHSSLENYRRTKERAIEHLQPHGVAVLNADDPNCCRMLARIDNPVLTFGIEQPAEVSAVLVEQFVGEQTFLLIAGSESAAVRTRIIGKQHIYNCLAAATLGLAYGIDLKTIARGLESVQRIPGRMDRVEFGQGYGLWLDAADSPHQLAASLEALRGVTSGRVICSLLPRSTYASVQRRRMFQTIKRLADISIVTDACSDHTSQADGNDSFNYASAIAWTLRQARPGDSVLIAASPDAAVGQLSTDDGALVQQWLRDVAIASETSRAAA